MGFPLQRRLLLQRTASRSMGFSSCGPRINWPMAHEIVLDLDPTCVPWIGRWILNHCHQGSLTDPTWLASHCLTSLPTFFLILHPATLESLHCSLDNVRTELSEGPSIVPFVKKPSLEVHPANTLAFSKSLLKVTSLLNLLFLSYSKWNVFNVWNVSKVLSLLVVADSLWYHAL